MLDAAADCITRRVNRFRPSSAAKTCDSEGSLVSDLTVGETGSPVDKRAIKRVAKAPANGTKPVKARLDRKRSPAG